MSSTIEYGIEIMGRHVIISGKWYTLHEGDTMPTLEIMCFHFKAFHNVSFTHKVTCFVTKIYFIECAYCTRVCVPLQNLINQNVHHTMKCISK